jgi:signal transduction histidine kinase
VRADQRERQRLALDRAARWGSAFEQDVEIHLPDGRIRWVRLTCASRLEGDRVAGLYGSAQDITAMVEALRARDAFVSVVSHELRTPRTSICGSLGLLSSGVAGTLPDEAQKRLALASSNCERQIHLVNDLLDMERINSGRLELRKEAIPLRPFLERALGEHEGYALSLQARLVLHLPEDTLQVRGDPDRLQQVLANLLSNACKFSPPAAQ